MHKFAVHKGNNKQLTDQVLVKRGNWVEASEKDQDDFRVAFIWRPVPLAHRTMSKLNAKIYSHIIINHFESTKEITQKHHLVRTLTTFYQNLSDAIKAEYNVFDSTSTSFWVTAGVDDLPYIQFLTRFRELQKGSWMRERLPLKHCTQNMWLLKPANENQGRGIEVMRNLREIQTSLFNKQMHSSWVLQKYIEKPMLFKGRKFDIRIWAMGTAKQEYYFYKRGYLRTSSDVYDTNAKDNFIHLTNNCLQQHGGRYGAHEDGNTLSLEVFQEYLDQQFPNLNLSYKEDIEPRIIDLIIDTFASAKAQLTTGPRKNDFELFGFDFLIDEDFRVWLIECNCNPYLGVPNQFIEDLLPRLINDIFRLTIDKVYPPKVDLYPDEENQFELLLSDTVNKRRPYTTSCYPRPEFEQTPMYKIPRETDFLNRDSPIIKKIQAPLNILQQVKDIAERYMIVDPDDFAKPLSRVMRKLNKWQKLSEEDTKMNWEALTVISRTKGFRATYLYLTQLFALFGGKDVPSTIKLVSLEALAALAKAVTIRKEIVRDNFIHKLWKVLVSDDYDNDFKKYAFEILKQLSTRSSKLYIPGETREVTEIRLKFLIEGGYAAVWYASQNEESKERALQILDDFDIVDLEQQMNFCEQVLVELDPQYTPLMPKSKKPSTEHELTHDFPKCLRQKEIISAVIDHIKINFAERKELRKRKIQAEKNKKLKEEADKLKLREDHIKKQVESQRIQENLYQQRIENRQQKQKAEKNRIKKEKQNEAAMEIMRKRAISDYVKRRDEKIRNEKRAKNQKIQQDKQLIDQLNKEREQQRKKALDDWIKGKIEQEKAKKTAQMKAEEEEIKKKEEFAKYKNDRLSERKKYSAWLTEVRNSVTMEHSLIQDEGTAREQAMATERSINKAYAKPKEKPATTKTKFTANAKENNTQPNSVISSTANSTEDKQNIDNTSKSVQPSARYSAQTVRSSTDVIPKLDPYKPKKTSSKDVSPRKVKNRIRSICADQMKQLADDMTSRSVSPSLSKRINQKSSRDITIRPKQKKNYKADAMLAKVYGIAHQQKKYPFVIEEN